MKRSLKSTQIKYFLLIDTYYKKWIDKAKSRVMKFVDTIKLDSINPFETLSRVLLLLVDEVFDSFEFNFGVNTIGKATIDFNNKKYDKDIEQILGFNSLADVKEKILLDTWTRENVDLIKGIGQGQVDYIKQIMMDGIAEGTSRKDLISQISESMGYDKNHWRMKLIVDDQTNKLNGVLDQLKQQEIGIEKYEWISVGDQSVRTLHQEYNGQIFDWDNPPDDGHPGQPIRCRCRPNPQMDDIFGKGFMDEVGLNDKYEKSDWLKREEKKHKFNVTKKPKIQGSAKVKKNVDKKVSKYVKRKKSTVTKKHKQELIDSVTVGSGFKSFKNIPKVEKPKNKKQQWAGDIEKTFRNKLKNMLNFDINNPPNTPQADLLLSAIKELEKASPDYWIDVIGNNPNDQVVEQVLKGIATKAKWSKVY